MAYVHQVRGLAHHFKLSPDRLGDDQIRHYLLHLLHDKHAAETSYNQAVAALRFFYEVSSPSGTVVRRLPYGKQSKRLPEVRSVQEVAVFLNALPGRTIPMVLRTIYATGMRISKALHLTAAQIDSSRMVVRVLGKGRKERLVPLSPRLLEELRSLLAQDEANVMDVPGQGPPEALEHRRRCRRPVGRPATWRGCRRSRRTPCATAMPHISWKRGSTSERSKPCWAIIGSAPRPCIRT